MDPQVQGSFIPKKSLDVSASNRSPFGGLVFLIALLIFIASIVAAGAAFAYKQYLTNAIATKSHQLQLAEGAYDPGAIEDLLKLDNRLNQAKTLLQKHVGVSNLFAFVSTQTLQNVYWSTFDYSLGDDGSAKIALQGNADSFATVALQSDQLNSNKLLKNVIFSGVAVDGTGHVTFSVTATVDSSVVSYENALQNGITASTDTSTTAQPTTTQSTTTSAPAFH